MTLSPNLVISDRVELADGTELRGNVLLRGNVVLPGQVIAPGRADASAPADAELSETAPVTDSSRSAVLRRSDLLDLPVVDFVGASGRPRTSTTASAGQGEESGAATQEQLEAAFEQGMAAGRQAAESAAERVIEAVQLAVERTEMAARQQLEETNGLAVDLALELAALILGREIAASTNPGRDAIERCLAETAAFGPITVRLNPEDIACLDEPTGVTDSQHGANYRVIADPHVASGDAIVDIDGGRLDGSITAALARVAEVLRP